MSSVTRLHLLSQSMLNVSCQKQKLCSSLPTDSLPESPMECVGQPSSSEACGLLAVPGLGSLDLDDDDDGEDIVIGIRPKSSPLPRRRSSTSDDGSEPEPPLSGSRRVSFADAKGLNLVQVKEFDKWDIPSVPGHDYLDGRSRDEEEYFLAPLNFSIHLSTEELIAKVHEQKVELETIELLPGTTIIKGMVRVLNVSFMKAVYIRTSLDHWMSHFDLLAEYSPGSSDGTMDSFSFKLTLVPPFEELGTRVDFCLRYETSVGTFWSNNNNMNYVLLCHQRVKELNEKAQKEIVHKKSCLKTVSHNFDAVENIPSEEISPQENVSTDVSKPGMDVNTVGNNQTNGSPNDTKEENKQKLQAENRQNRSRRNRRKAARMARLRDYYAQRDTTTNDSESDASHSPTAETSGKESPAEKRSLTEVSIKSEDSPSVPESYLATCSTSTLDVQHDASKENDCASTDKAGKSENPDVSDSATFRGVMTDSHDNPLPSNDEPVFAERARQHTNKSVSKVEQRSQEEPGMSYECANPAGEPHDGLVKQSNSYSFGTVVAPLYHQVFVGVQSESRSLGDISNPVWSTLSNLHMEKGENCTQSSQNNIQRNLFPTQEMNPECADSSPRNNPHNEKTEGLSVIIAASGDNIETKQDQVEIRKAEGNFIINSPIRPDIAPNPQPGYSRNSSLLNAAQSLSLKGETQEGDLTRDLPETAARTLAQTPESSFSHTCGINTDKSLSRPETQMCTSSVENSSLSFQSRSDQEANTSAAQSDQERDYGENASLSTNRASSAEVLRDDSPPKRNVKSSVSCLETVKQMDVTRTECSAETQKTSNDSPEVIKNSNEEEEETKQTAKTEVFSSEAEVVTKALASTCHVHSDMFVKPEVEDTFKATKIIFPLKVEHNETEAAVSKEDFNLYVKNWEIMVEEEEADLLTGEDEGEAASLETEDVHVDQTEAAEKQSEGSGSEHREDDAETLVPAEEEEEEEEEEDTAADVDEELEEILKESVETTKGREEEDGEKECARQQEANEAGTDTRQGGETGAEEEINMTEHESGVKLSDQVKSEEDPGEEEEEMMVIDGEGGGLEGSGGVETGHEGDEESLDETQNNVKDHFSAPVNDTHQDTDGRAIDREGAVEGQRARTTFHCNDGVTRESLEEAAHEDEGGSHLLPDEPGIDQTSDNSASSSESGSDDEVELYMRCLRAVHGQHTHRFTHTDPDHRRDQELSLARRLSGSRTKPPSASLPSISESVDEEQHLSQWQDGTDDTETAGFIPTAPALSASSEEENIEGNTSWWKDTFSCSSFSKTLLYTTLVVLFLALAYHYDFLACFGLYLISVVWLCCQGEKQPVKNNNRLG